MGDDSTSGRCKNRLVNHGLLECLYKYFSRNKVLDECDNELIKDRYSTVQTKDLIFVVLVLVSVPALAVAGAAYYREQLEPPKEPDFWGYAEEPEPSWMSWIAQVPFPEAWMYIAFGSLLITIFALIYLYRLYVLFCATSFIFSSCSLDSLVNTLFSAIREREIISFGVLASTTLQVPLCSRQLRMDLLASMRGIVHKFISASDRIARGIEKDKLLCRFFTEPMKDLALSDATNDELLRLPALKDLWKLMFLLRSEYIRLVLLRFVESGCCKGLKLFCEMRSFKKQNDKFKSRFSKAVRYAFLDQEGDEAKLAVPGFTRPGMSATDKAMVQLGLQAGEEHREKVLGVLHETVDLLAPPKAKPESEGENQIEIADESITAYRSQANGDEVFEGISEMREAEPQEQSFSYTSKTHGKAAMTRALVSELKNVLSRKKKSKKSASSTDSEADSSRERK